MTRDKYYYKQVYLGCVRANDFIYSLPQFDGSHLAVRQEVARVALCLSNCRPGSTG